MSAVEHVVFFPAPDGTPAFRRLPSLDEVVSFVEHLRNEQEVREVSVHALTEVPLAFKTVYRVEVAVDNDAAGDAGEGELAAPAAVDAPVPAPVVEPASEPAPAEPITTAPAADAAAAVDVPAQEGPADAEPVAAGDAKTLGFFAS